MKKFFNNMNRKVNNAIISAKCALQNHKAEGYVDTGVKILIAVVLGALVLSLLYTLINTNIMPNVTSKVNELFNYPGGGA